MSRKVSVAGEEQDNAKRCTPLPPPPSQEGASEGEAQDNPSSGCTPSSSPDPIREEMARALEHVRAIIADAAMTGFNYNDGNWVERLYASQAITHAALSLHVEGSEFARLTASLCKTSFDVQGAPCLTISKLTARR